MVEQLWLRLRRQVGHACGWHMFTEYPPWRLVRSWGEGRRLSQVGQMEFGLSFLLTSKAGLLHFGSILPRLAVSQQWVLSLSWRGKGSLVTAQSSPWLIQPQIIKIWPFSGRKTDRSWWLIRYRKKRRVKDGCEISNPNKWVYYGDINWENLEKGSDFFLVESVGKKWI